MTAHRTACGKVVKFGTLIDDTVNSNHTKFGVSNSNSLAPPLVQNLHLHKMKIFFSSESLAQAKSNEVQNSKIVRFSFFRYLQMFVKPTFSNSS